MRLRENFLQIKINLDADWDCYCSRQLKEFPDIKKEAISRKEAIQGIDKKSNIKVSAIVSTYNSEMFIAGCLEDLINQTLYQKGELEIVVIDSGSKQNEKKIVQDFQKRYDNIKYIRTEERETVYAAWNRGIKAAKGKYITSANTDDRHRRDALEIMSSILDERTDIGLVYADVIITETENETFDKHTPVGHFQWLDFDITTLSVGCYIGPQPVWKRALHDKYGYFDETFSASGDWEFWLRIAGDTHFHHTHEYLGLYLRSREGIEHGNTVQRLQEDRIIYERYIPRYLPDYDKYFSEVIKANPGDRAHLYRYGQVLATFGRYDEAVNLYLSYSRSHPDSHGLSFFIKELEALKASRTSQQLAAGSPNQKKIGPTVVKSKLKVSAIVSTYNSERFMHGCLEDLVNQTLYKRGQLEIIVIDSGSQEGEKGYC